MGWIGLVAGRLSDRFDPRILILIGLAAFALDMYFFSSLTLLAGIGLVTGLVITQRGAFGLIQSPISNAVMRTLPSEDRSMGSGLHGVHRGVAAAFGVALCSLLLEKRMAVHGVLLGQYHDLLALPVQQSLGAFRHFLLQAGEVQELAAGKSMAALGQVLARHVRIAAYADCFLLLSIAFILALIPAFLIRATSQASRPPPPPAKPAAVASVAREEVKPAPSA
jgi:DHA2 family multidrug resistance protein